MNSLIKLRVGLKGQLNHVSRLIKATSLREHRDVGRVYWKDARTHNNMNAGIKHFENHKGKGIRHTLNQINDRLAVKFVGCDCESYFTVDALIVLEGIRLI